MVFFFFKQKTAYEMRISDWSSDVCSSDLPAADGWLYFGSRRPGGLGKDDIWRARRTTTGAWQVENAGPAINSTGAEYEFQPAANGRWALLATDDGLFRVERGTDGWTPRVRLDATINATGPEIGRAEEHQSEP